MIDKITRLIEFRSTTDTIDRIDCNFLYHFNKWKQYIYFLLLKVLVLVLLFSVQVKEYRKSKTLGTARLDYNSSLTFNVYEILGN